MKSVDLVLSKTGQDTITIVKPAVYQRSDERMGRVRGETLADDAQSTEMIKTLTSEMGDACLHR